MENPWASRKRRWAASPSTSSSTHRMVFGRGIGLSYGDWRTRATQDLFGSVLCVLLVRFSSIGDILLTTPLVRALAARHPEAKLVYVTKRAMAPLVADNPHLAEVVTLEPGEPIRHLARRLRALAPTHGLDLHGSVRSASLRVLVSCRWSGYCKRKLARALLIATKLDAYRRRAPSPNGGGPPGTGRSSSAGPKTAGSRSSSWPKGEARSRVPPASFRSRRRARCSPGRGSWCRATPASCTWPRASGHQSSRCSD